MAYSFEEIMAYHPDNVDVYREIKQLLPRLIPFIGAGLTQFAYCSWPSALKALSSKMTNGVNAQKVTNLINSKCYLDAAQLLEDFRTPANLARDLATIFSADKLKQKRGQLLKEPISLLPHLFPNLVLTTNFDETLETVYRESGHSFQTVFLPGHPELLRQLMRQGGVRGLFKLHGTVTGGLIEYEKIVFTRTQYDRHYGKDSPLTRELKACFENRMVLFLGCSLDNDRTMELLQEVIHPGDSYYTVISCEPSERDEKVRQLGEKHIRAILYEKDHHEAVRVILEHLLEEIDPESYNALPIHAGLPNSIDQSEQLFCKAGIINAKKRKHESGPPIHDTGNNRKSNYKHFDNKGKATKRPKLLHLLQNELLRNIFVLLLQVIGTTGLFFGIVFIFYGILSDSANVTVEINEIPNNWLVKTFVAAKDDNSTVGSGIRGQIHSDQFTISTKQNCIIFGADTTQGGRINPTGTFFVNEEAYTNAFVVVEQYDTIPSQKADLGFHDSEPIIEIALVSNQGVASSSEVVMGLSGQSVEQHLSVDFNSYFFEFLSSGKSRAEAYGNSMMASDIMLNSNSDIDFSFKNCNAYIVIHCIDNTDGIGGIMMPITHCRFRPISNQSPLIFGVPDRESGDPAYYKLEIPIKSNFSVSSSNFSSVSLYGVGKLYFAYTAKGTEYPLHDQEVELEHKDFENHNDNIYTFTHNYLEDTSTEKNMFRLNAFVNTATIAGESVMPNFRSWFRENMAGAPQNLVALILAQLAIFGFLDFHFKKKN